MENFIKFLKDTQGLKRLATTWDGRINRQPFCFMILAVMLVNIVSVILASIFVTILPILALPFLLVYLLVGLATICPTITRTHDLGYTGWLIFLMFVPIVNMVYFILLLAMEGTPQDNQYGANPLKK